MDLASKIAYELKSLANAEKAAIHQRFFKTAPGEYGAGDRFHGVTVPQQRSIAKKHLSAATEQAIQKLLQSDFHEERLTALLLLVYKFKKDHKKSLGEKWVKLYLKNTHRVNNWDLVDSSAHHILGAWLENKDRKLLYQLADSSSLWENRIAVIATAHFIRKNDLTDILRLSEKLIDHPHDLMHKAVGWMLREAWRRDSKKIESFIQINATNMPRTMLRYAIEKMSDEKRKSYLTIK
jgi:3-methyladenine DNA glycosylase AlkD